MGDTVRSVFADVHIDFAVRVPDHRFGTDGKNQKSLIGFNASPSIRLATAVCDDCKIGLKKDMLYYFSETEEKQQGQGLIQRFANVFGEFDVKDEALELLGSNVLLIDAL